MARKEATATLSVIAIGLCVGSFLGLWATRLDPGGTSVERQVRPTERERGAVTREEVFEIQAGSPLRQTMVGGQVHVYLVVMRQGELIQGVAEQQGIDVEVQLFGPRGDRLMRVDSPNGARGPEEFLAVAEEAGEYRLRIAALDEDSPQGEYEIRWEPPRPATSQDRDRAAAWKLFTEGEELREQGADSAMREALKKYESSLPLWQRAGDLSKEADTLYRLGWMARELSEPDRALEAYRKALPLLQQLKRLETASIVLNRMGSLHFRRSDWTAARAEYQQALDLSRELQRPDLEAGSLSGLGNVANASGDSQQALDLYQEARQRAEAGGDAGGQAIALSGLGDVLLEQGRPEDALQSFTEALRLLRKVEKGRISRDQASVIASIGDVYWQLGEYAAAQERLEQALSMKERVGDRAGLPSILNSLGVLALRQERFAEAGTWLTRSRALCQEFGNRQGQAFAALHLGQQAWHQGSYLRSLELHQEAALLFHEMGNARGEAATLFGAARVLHSQGRDETALHLLKTVLDNVEALRSETESLDLRTTYFATRQHYFELYLDVLRDLYERDPRPSYVADAVEVNERRRARGFLDLLNAAGKEGRKKPEVLSLAEIQQEVLDPSSLLLVYSLGAERSHLWLIPHEGEVRWVALPGRLWLEALAREVYRVWSHPGGLSRSAQRHAQRLSDELLGAVADRLAGMRLVVVADGALQLVPFAALPSPLPALGRPAVPLIVDHQVVSLPSASILAQLRRDFGNRATARERLALIADPIFDRSDERYKGEDRAGGGLSARGDLARSAQDLGLQHLARLPYSGVEAEAIRQLVPEDLRFEAIGFAARRQAVTGDSLGKYRIIHFATHGLLNEKHPELSGLVLSQIDEEGRPLEEDGFLTASDVLQLRLNAELVVLSACQTGAGRDLRGEGMLSLTRPFFYAGAPRVVSSLWKVSDRGTAELMKRFYEGMLSRNLTPAEALRRAQRLFLEEGRLSSPYYWAPFVFQGDWVLKGSLDGGIGRVDTGAETAAKSISDLPEPDPTTLSQLLLRREAGVASWGDAPLFAVDDVLPDILQNLEIVRGYRHWSERLLVGD